MCNTLIYLKEKYPERVFLLIGNRDVNKIALTFEKYRYLYNKDVDYIEGKRKLFQCKKTIFSHNLNQK